MYYNPCNADDAIKISNNHIDNKNWHDNTNSYNDKYDDPGPPYYDPVIEEVKELNQSDSYQTNELIDYPNR